MVNIFVQIFFTSSGFMKFSQLAAFSKKKYIVDDMEISLIKLLFTASLGKILLTEVNHEYNPWYLT